MELIKPQKQNVWKWPAVVNFTCGGIGTGFYLLALLVALPKNGEWLTLLLQSNGDWLQVAIQAAVFRLLGPALVGLGFMALTSEAGRPQRGINLFRHLRRSWMSRETLAFAIFAPFAGLDWLFAEPTFRVLAALGAIALMFSQGMIPYHARGVTAWNSPIMPVFFVTAGFATGSGLLLVILAMFGMFNQPMMSTLLWFAVVSLAANLIVWFIYLSGSDNYFRQATESLKSVRWMLLIVALGHALPALCLLAIIIVPIANVEPLFFSAGLLTMLGGALQKWGIVIEAGYLRAIVLSAPQNIAQRTTAAK